MLVAMMNKDVGSRRAAYKLTPIDPKFLSDSENHEWHNEP